MKFSRLLVADCAGANPVLATPAFAAGDPPAAGAMARGIPAQLDSDQRDGYRAVFAAIREQRWGDAQIQLDAMKPGPLHSIAAAELYPPRDRPRSTTIRC